MRGEEYLGHSPWGPVVLTTISVAMLVAAFLIAIPHQSAAAERAGATQPQRSPIQLARPNAGNPAVQLLEKRSSSRDFSSQPLSTDILSNLLWAAWGVNRPDGHRTAPTAMNRQDMDVYAVLPDGAYLYDAKANQLRPVASGDLRALTGSQPFVREAPLNLVYVSDYSKLKGTPDEMVLYSAAHTGFMAENVYIYCASEGLSTVIRAMVDRPALAKALRLSPDQHITLCQTVGFPKKR